MKDKLPGASIRPISPMQGGMLYHHLLAENVPDKAGYNIEQLHITLKERLQVGVLGQAFTDVARAYPVLSSAFDWSHSEGAGQLPVDNVTVPVAVLDWRGGEVNQLRQQFLQNDRLRGFDLRVAPLMRLTLAQLSDSVQELYFTFHHILMDGRSFVTVLHQAFARYQALLLGREAAMPVEASTFGDYIQWHCRLDHQASLEYFRQLLAGKQAPTPLPLTEPANRPLQAVGYGAVINDVDAALRQSLRALAAQHDTTLGGVIQVAWALLLARLTGDQDVMYGIVRTCRYAARSGEFKSTVGLFINTLPARIAIDEQESVGGLLGRAREQWLAQRQHDQTPLMDVQAQSELPAGSPLFESLMVYDNHGMNEELRKLDPSWESRHCTLHEQPTTPLALVVEDGEVLQLRVLYDRRRFTVANAERLARYLLAVLDSLLHARLVSDVQILAAAERQQIVYGWNDTDRSFSDQLLIHQLFERQAELQPNAPAVACADVTLTFAEVEARANRLAQALRARGIGPGQFVGLCLTRSVELVVAMLGVAKSGAAYVPIDPDYPADRVDFILQDTGASLLLVDAGRESTRPVPVLAVNDSSIVTGSVARPPMTASSDQVCYVIYTSGSTGKPKGVVLTHRAVVNTLEWVSREFHVGPGDRALFVTSPCFDLSVYDVFGVLGAGGMVVVATQEMLREPRDLVNVLVQGQITVWNSAPAALQRLVPMLPSQGGRHLRLVMLSGDWIALTLPDAIRRCFPAAQIKSLGGATEAAIWSNWFAIGDIDPRWNSVPYGRPIQNSQYYVLDHRREPVPPGVTGDLYISGTCLASGYLNRDELTAERFVSNPFRPGERMYLTGDLARYFDDGVIEFLGRADFQVKIRGFRVELGEVEAALLALPDVRDAVCTAFTDISGAKALVAYVTSKTNAVIDGEAIKATLRRSLPDFMVPARIITLAAMPLSSNGKVDRKALPDPTAESGAADVVALNTRAEKKMAVIWRRLLKQEQLGLNSNFFELGGDSLLAVALVLEIERRFHRPFPLARVLEYPTLGAMAAAVGSKGQLKHLVTLTPNNPVRPPMFLFSGGGGFGFFYRDLAKALGPDQPVHVFNAIGADDADELAGHSIEEMAAIYEAEIQELYPAGPLVLGGYSFGATLAYELTRLLAEHGREVSLLISFDGPAPGHPVKLPLFQRLYKHFSDLMSLDSAHRRDYLRDRWVNVRQRFHSPEDHPLLAPPPGIDPDMANRLRRLSADMAQARGRYKPNTCLQCEVLLLKAEHQLEWPGHTLDAQYGWGSFTNGGVETVIVPGSHLYFFGEQNNGLIADAIRQRIGC